MHRADHGHVVRDGLHVRRQLAHFDAALATQFDAPIRLVFHMAAPWDHGTGGAAPRKRAYGPWLRAALRVLAHGRVLCGSVLDPFGWRLERRSERALASEYEAVIRRLALQLDGGRIDAAMAIAELPERVRGFGPLKQRQVVLAREGLATLLAAYEAARPARVAPA